MTSKISRLVEGFYVLVVGESDPESRQKFT